MSTKSTRGLYLVEPHGRLIYDGRKMAIAKSKHIPLSGTWVIVSKEQGVGLGYGVAAIGESRIVDITTFDAEFESHRVTLKERSRWWPDATELHLWPIRSFEVYSQPRRVHVPPGTKTIMDTLEFIPDAPGDSPDIEPGQDRERPYTETGRPREGDASGELAKDTPRTTNTEIVSTDSVKAREVNMPWTVKNPPSCAKNWTESEKKKCVEAANAVLREGGTEQNAIFACIRNAGKTEYPGGESKKARGEGQGVGGPRQGEGGPEHCVCPKCGELVIHEPDIPCTEMKCPKCGTRMEPEPGESQSTKAVWTTVYQNNLPDSHFFYVETGPKDESGKTTPRSLRHLPYKDASGKIDPAHVRNAISRAPRVKDKDGHPLSETMVARIQSKARKILAAQKKELGFAQEAARAREISVTMTRLKGLFDGEITDEQLTTMSENLVNLKAIDPDTGESAPQICVCPQCGHSSEQLPNAPCAKMGCPKCGTAMKPQEDVEPEEPPEEPPKAIKSSRIIKFLDGVITNAKSILGIDLGGATKPRGEPGTTPGEIIGYKTFTAQDGRTWLILSAVNAFQDREGEIFTTKSIEEYVARHEDEPKKSEFWFYHMPGTKFADIVWQGMSGRFLYEAGPFDDTIVGKTFERFFTEHPHGHPAVAPRGWGASHGYVYNVLDRKDLVYDWFEKRETSVLALELASNLHNSELEVMMNTKQIEALRAIGGDALVEHVTEAGEEHTKDLEGHVAFKSVPADPKVETPAAAPDLAKSSGWKMSALERRELALDMSEILQLGELSRVVSAQTEVLSQLAEKMKANNEHMDDVKVAVDTRITALERSDEEKLAERQLSLPRYAWFRASTAPETTSMARAAEALKERHPGVPGAVNAIVDKLTG